MSDNDPAIIKITRNSRLEEERSLVMKSILKPFTWSFCLTAILIFNPLLPLQAEEVDFSCMKHRVRAKIAVSDRFREFDVIVENRCPGPVYWSMCIERMHTKSSKIIETLTPSGQVQVDKKTRVNLRMNVISDESDPKLEFEKFYLDVAFDLNPNLSAQCVATACEAKKGDLRKASRANDKALQQFKVSLADRISSECSQSGWNGNGQAECEAGIREAAQAELDRLIEKQAELDAQLATIDPEICQVY
jgi:hypothetical protein